ncbi:MAG: baseplate wedge protein [Flavobacteriales bacterium TMED228]|nr:MAG: baseplate wedge protein [Flavobacteriales bacterium TMED228]|tara:strand:+ start:4928 stop:6154 length:1227 start_codon:yes stop_codon:yes gene_type:complete
MAKQSLNLGTVPNDNTGDTLRGGGDKINDNFNELYSAIGNGTSLTVDVTNPAVGQVLRYTGSQFAPSDYANLTSSLDVNGNSIVSSSNGNITVAANGSGNISLGAGGVNTVFQGADGIIDMPTKVKYKNEFSALGNAPSAATYPGYFFTVDGDDNPYVNINITTGGVGDVRAKVATEYSSIDVLADVDTTTAAPTNLQVLKWSSSSNKWTPQNDESGLASLNTWATITGDTGSTTANAQADTLTIAGGSNITTTIVNDTLTVDFSGTLTTTLAALTDTDLSGVVQGDSLFFNGTNWIATRSPITWWELNANGASDYTFSGPGFASATADATLYVMRGQTYAFDNTVQSTAHPFRIQSTQGLTGTPYTTGQTGSGTGVLYWTVPMAAPGTLYYQCTLHAAMQGTINVVG